METVNANKMKELVLYVSSRLAGDPHNGTIKRNKVLAFADFAHFAQHGRSITGAEYVKQPYGPAPRGIRALEHELVGSGEAQNVIIGFGPRAQKMLFPAREAKLDDFTGNEVASVEAALDLLDGKTGMESSDLSHAAMLGWKYGRELQPIPYQTVFLYDGVVTDAERRAGESILDRLKEEIENERQPARA